MKHNNVILSTIRVIAAREHHVIITLACGHEQVSVPGHGYSAASWAEHLQFRYHALVPGVSKMRCEEEHATNEEPTDT